MRATILIASLAALLPTSSVSFARGQLEQLGPVQSRTSKAQSDLTPQVLTQRDQNQIPSGAYCEAKDAKGRVIFTATDYGIIKLSGRVIRLQLGKEAWSSRLMLAYDQSAWVEFRPRAGRKSVGEESTSEPMTMRVGRSGRSATLPVMRTCGA